MRSRRWILGILIIVLIGAVLFAPSYGWQLRMMLTPGAARANTSANGDDGLSAQIDALKAEIATYAAIAKDAPQSSQANYIRAMVYSRYPLNFRNQLLVNVGAANGVTTGTAAIFDGMLLGRVTSVFPHESVVTTMFDSNFEMPVRIGTSSYDGLFQGGAFPKVGSIPRTATLHPGDIVFAAAPGVPYGLPIGEVSVANISADSLFNEAVVTFPYDVNDVQTVLIAEGQ